METFGLLALVALQAIVLAGNKNILDYERTFD